MNRVLLVCVLVCVVVGLCAGYPEGAPGPVCQEDDLIPTGHVKIYKATGENNIDQYTLTKEPGSDYINVTLKDNKGLTFKGFVIKGTSSTAAEFKPNTVAKLMNCSDPLTAAVTHRNSNDKPQVSVIWSGGMDATFKATVVLDKFKYVKNIQ